MSQIKHADSRNSTTDSRKDGPSTSKEAASECRRPMKKADPGQLFVCERADVVRHLGQDRHSNAASKVATACPVSEQWRIAIMK